MRRILFLSLLLSFLSLPLLAQCDNELGVEILEVICVPSVNTGPPSYYVRLVGTQSAATTSFFDLIIGSPAIVTQQPYDIPITVGPLTTSSNVMGVILRDGPNPECFINTTINLADVECQAFECVDPPLPLTLDIEEPSICPGDAITYETPVIDAYDNIGFRLIEQLSATPFEDGNFFGTIGGRAQPNNYNTPGTWYYVRLAYALVTQNGPQYDFPCTVLSNVDSFYVGGFDLSHLEPAYDLACAGPSLTLTAASPGSPIPAEIEWQRDGVIISTANEITIDGQTGNYSLTVADEVGCSAIFQFVVSDEGFSNLPNSLTNINCNNGDPFWCIEPFQDGWNVTWPVEGGEGSCAFNLNPGDDYDITITNQTGCTEVVTLTADPVWIYEIIANTLPGGACETDDLVIDLATNDPNFPGAEIFVEGPGMSQVFPVFNFPLTLDELPPGEYIISGVVYERDCPISFVSILLEGSPTFSVNAQTTNTSCPGDADGSIILDAQPAGNYTYDWAENSFDGLSILTNLPAGFYRVTVTNEEGCIETRGYSIEEPTHLDLQSELVNPSCGGTDGRISVLATGGTGNPLFYQYQWSDGWDTSDNQNLPAGDYSVTVFDANGCSVSQNFTLFESGINITIAASNNGVLGCANEVVTLRPLIDDLPGLTYVWTMDGQALETTRLLDVTEPGTYTLAVTSESGCTGEASFTVIEVLEPQEYNVIGLPANCEGSGVITVEIPDLDIINDITIYYNNTPIEGGSFDGNFFFSAPLPVATYQVEITDRNDCVFTQDITIETAADIELVSEEITHISCAGPGSIRPVFADPSGITSYTWSDGQTSPTLEGITNPGVYYLAVTDANNCTAIYAFTVTDISMGELFFGEVSPNCVEENGTLTVFFEGGQAPFDYAWSNGGTTATISNLAPGSYDVTVTDANDCVRAAVYVLLERRLINTINWLDPGCGQANGWMEVQPEDETLDLSYQWSNGATTRRIENLSAGTYQVTVTDDLGCTETAAQVLFDSLDIVVFIDATGDGTINCNQPFVTLIANAPPGFEFFWDLADGTNQTGPIITVDIPGPYTVTAFDPNSPNFCTISTDFEVIQDGGEGPTFTAVGVDPDCNSDVGSILMTIDNPAEATIARVEGEEGIIFLEFPVNGNEQIEFPNLPGGVTYQVMLFGLNECITTQFITLSPSGGIEGIRRVNPTCEGAANGSLEVIFSNNTTGTVSWSTGATTPFIGNLSAGDYEVTITTESGCELVRQITLTGEPFNVAIEAPGGLDCNNSTVELVAFPNQNGIAYTWAGPDGFTSNQASVTVGTPGEYSVTVTAVNANCGGEATYLLEPGEDGFSVRVEVQPDPECNGGAILRPIFTPEQDELDLIHEWTIPDGSVIEFPIAGLYVFDSGTYIYTATNPETGCTASDEVFVAAIPSTDCQNLSGRLWVDEGNCQLDGTETPVAQWWVAIESTTNNFGTQTITDDDGGWNADVPPGTYTVRALPYVEDLYIDCDPLQEVTLTVDESAYVDVFMPYVEECASMYVDVAVPFLRRCFENSFYVWYCNDGPVIAENAQITLTLDPFLDFTGASLPFSSISANTVTFDLGDVLPFDCGFINVTALVSCEAELGQTHCVEATITPNDPCPVVNDWNGANLTLNANCDGDEITFSIINDGDAATTVPLQYIVIEDGIMLMDNPEPGPILGIGESFDFVLPANGSTYYVQTNQEPGNPGFDMPTLIVEGCGVNEFGGFTTGFVNTLPLGDNDVNWYDISCRENVGSYDPNIKVGYPLGYGDQNFIEEGTKLTYDIYFQNTGTDTAFTVVIRDTLAPELDPTTLRMGAASHDYVYDLDSNNVLTVTFDDILLPDSSTNLAASIGVVQFTIDHTAGLPLLTEIRNNAGIYFDFNEPIITNTTLHTIGEDFLPTNVRRIIPLVGGMEVYPNPTSGNVNVKLDLPGDGPFRLRLFDAFGRELRTQTFPQLNGNIDLTGLPQGWYLLRGENEAGGGHAAVKVLLQ
ncbi:MAG: T9SS type A sorting domain-containing protein [Bacteroidota bacterium]